MPITINDSSYGAVVVSNTKKVLLIKQRTGSNYPSYWALPKGHKHLDETALEAAIREVNEECGLTLNKTHANEDIWLKESYQYKGTLHGDAWVAHAAYPDVSKRPSVFYDKTVYYTLLKVQGEPETHPQLEEVEEACWFLVHEAVRLLKHEAQRRVLLKLYSKSFD